MGIRGGYCSFPGAIGSDTAGQATAAGAAGQAGCWAPGLLSLTAAGGVTDRGQGSKRNPAAGFHVWQLGRASRYTSSPAGPGRVTTTTGAPGQAIRCSCSPGPRVMGSPVAGWLIGSGSGIRAQQGQALGGRDQQIRRSADQQGPGRSPCDGPGMGAAGLLPRGSAPQQPAARVGRAAAGVHGLGWGFFPPYRVYLYGRF